MKPAYLAFVSGLVFALGLSISGMTQPTNVLAFLDVTGHCDPSLAVMGVGLTVVAAVRRLSPPRPLLASEYSYSTARGIDSRLVAGVSLFGAGWGLGGFCPGPSLASLGAGCPAAFVFVAAMAVGMLLFHRVDLLLEARSAVGSPQVVSAGENT